jgi:hypothetical protein
MRACLQRHVIAPDFKMLMRTTSQSLKLAYAYYFTRNLRYARKLASKLRTFFLDGKTGMMPSMLYSHWKPGIHPVGAPQVCAANSRSG